MRLRDGVAGVLPRRLREPLGSRIRLGRFNPACSLPEPLDLSPLAAVRTADADRLLDPAWLERLLASLGLSEDLGSRSLFPDELSPFLGTGLRQAQYPNQLAPYLVELAGRRIRSYLEIGAQHGGTFLLLSEYLRRTSGLERALAVDLYRVPAIADYRRAKPAVEVRAIRTSSASRRFRRLVEDEGPFDLVTIDADHSEEACRRDFEAVREHSRLIAFHDVVGSDTPGVVAVWDDAKRSYGGEFDFSEFVAQYPQVQAAHQGACFLGIGLAARRELPQPPNASG